MCVQGTGDLLVEHRHIKDALTRIVVEMIKREWPQQWPTMVDELDAIYKLDVCSGKLGICLYSYT